MSKLNCHKTKILKNKGNVKWQFDAFGISMFLNCFFHFQKKMSEQIDLISNSKLNDCFNQTVKRCYHCLIVVTKQTI